MREDNGPLPSAFESSKDMQEEGVIPVLRWRYTILKAFEFVFGGIEAVTPRLR